MPSIAIEHIARIELSEGGCFEKKHLLPFKNFYAPSLEFKVPAELLLWPGTKVRLDKNLVAESGELVIDSSLNPSLSLSISATNEDYNPHQCAPFKLYVQWENGEVWKYCTIGEPRGWGPEALPGKTTRKLGAALAYPGSRRLLSGGLHAVLLYRSFEGFFFEPQFCGFVPIPDHVRNA